MIDAALQVYKFMDKQGMLPAGLRCTRCGKILNADGGHPAELYAGTFTGLCYGCEKGPAYVVRRFPLDGAIVVSHPPICSSHSRRREEYTAYENCEACKGTGVVKVDSDWRWHTSWRVSCQESCGTRFRAHSVRQRHEKRTSKLYAAAEAVWKANLLALARVELGKRAKKKALSARAAEFSHDPRAQAIRREILARWSAAKTRWLPIEAWATETVR